MPIIKLTEDIVESMQDEYYRGIEGLAKAARTPKPLELQKGGTHYKNYPIQPIEYCERNQITALPSFIIKYATRAGDKGGYDGLLSDIDKIEHCAQIWRQIVTENEEHYRERYDS